MSKSLKTVVGVVAAIAIPFAAPAIAGSIGLSGAISGALGSTAAGGAIAGGLTGAALGAGTAALTGQDVGRGALFGGLGGGIGGYAQGAAAGTAGTAGAAAPSSAQGAATAAGTTAPAATVPTDFASSIAPAQTLPGGTGYAYSGVSGETFGALTAPAQLAAPTAAQPGFLSRLGSTLGVTPETLRRGGLQLATGALVGGGMPPGYEAALAEQRRARQMNERLTAERFAAAEDLRNQARYFDPEYMGLQSARDAQLRAARATQAGLRGTTGERRQTEQRRGSLETARQTGTAYDVGFGQGARTQTQLKAAAAGLIPTSYPTTMGDYSTLAAAYGAGEERRRRQAEDIGKFFGGLTDEEKKTGDEEKAG